MGRIYVYLPEVRELLGDDEAVISGIDYSASAARYYNSVISDIRAAYPGARVHTYMSGPSVAVGFEDNADVASRVDAIAAGIGRHLSWIVFPAIRRVIVSRHPAAVEFVRANAPEFINAPVLAVATGDDVRGAIVAGNLPLHLAALAAEVIAVEFTGAPPRGAEYGLAEMVAAGARLERYRVRTMADLDREGRRAVSAAYESGCDRRSAAGQYDYVVGRPMPADS